jgi:hypothetical protein
MIDKLQPARRERELSLHIRYCSIAVRSTRREKMFLSFFTTTSATIFFLPPECFMNFTFYGRRIVKKLSSSQYEAEEKSLGIASTFSYALNQERRKNFLSLNNRK